MPKLSKYEAYASAKVNGIDFDKDFFEISYSKTWHLVELAKLVGYRKPMNASGSLARYFYYHLQKLRRKHNWK